jgi:site-specific DNA-cytosine methylase
LEAPDLAKIGSIRLIILGWQCKGLSQVGSNQVLSDPKLRLFLDMIEIFNMFKHHRCTPCAFLLENVPPLGDSQLVVLIAQQ